MQVMSAESTELFVGPPDAPLQLARVTVSGGTEPTLIRVDGAGLRGEARAGAGQDVIEVPVAVEHPVVGQRRAAQVHVAGSATSFTFTVAEPGWTMFMISHFHYDPVWWNTQGGYTSLWTEDPPGRQTNGFELVHAHLEMARREPVYKFVLAEVDYLKPYWDTRPEDRADLRRLIAEGRVEIMGGTYNEPNTNLTSPETTIRNLVHGAGFQRDVLGADPATAWQLDVFGHDPQFPGMAADAGLTSSSWARGPHHQWGPTHSAGGVAGMQFCSEFEWIAPSGRGLLTHYMPAHYGAGWGMDESASLTEAEQATYRLFEELKKVALTRNVLLPVGTDYTPPNKWVTEIHRDWGSRYTWPRFVCAVPSEFFAAVRAELDTRALVASPQTRDMNPIYTGKDVSYIDTKQANRAAENAVLDAEKFAVFAGLLAGADYPQAALAKAWVQLVYGAHHDAITGSESDQVYLDLLTGWRDAWELGRAARDNSLALLSSAVTGDGSINAVAWNPLAHNRTDVVACRLDTPLGAGVRVLDHDGAELPAGPVVCSSETPAADVKVRAYHSPLGQRLVVQGRIGELLRYTQTLTLWHGVDRVDCSTTIDDFTDEDRLLRLRWPCPVAGAMPVSEVGDAVVGRGFALLHNGSQSVDTADRPWTLDNPAYGWFGLSSAARVRVGDGVRAVSVAEVVAPTEPMSGPLARHLVVALVRAGVTATCSSADRPRYGRLGFDSNLPDARFALGGPGQNAFTKAVLAAADPDYAREVERQLAESGRARVWVPAAAPLAAGWIPDADLRDSRALPVLVIASRDDADLGPAIASVTDDLVDAEIVVNQRAPSGLQRFEPFTVALLNRGVPSFAVESDGTLHTALMRSCTGWPSGVWIDKPRRTAPDGSNFQLQHWTHVFDYALVCGAGDWRHAEIPARSADFSNPLLAVTASGRVGGLPATGSLLQVEPAGAVHLGALKAAGNPLARGSAHPVDPSRVAIRLVETRGGDTDVVVRSPLGTVSELNSADLLERPQGRRRLTTLQGYQIGTALARLDVPRLLDGADTELAPQAENCQPLYARYWLHNRGPAPLGGLPAVAHLRPHRLTAVAGDDVALRLTAASDSCDAPLAGTVRLVCARGWSASPAELPFTLRPGEHLEADVTLKMPAHAGPGLYPVRAQLEVTGASLPPVWRQVVEDVCMVSIGEADDSGVAYLVDEPADVEVAAGESARLTATVGTDACADLSLEAHLISPWGTWEWIGPATLGAVLPARGTVEIGFDVSPPAWVESGQWWALIRVSCAGRLVYSPAVKVTVR